jgi:GrpB-like predicted nucleotidyltransferase (UPF0157 family)
MNDLSKMTLNELWELFPIILSEHNPEWFVWYDEEKENLLGLLGTVFHLHVKPVGDYDEIYFRDYIAAHPDDAARYAALKRSLFVEYEHNRDGYMDAKGAFVREITKKARKGMS